MSDSAFALRPTALAGLTVVKRAVQEDERGSFGRIFCSDDLLEAGWTWPVAQINRSTNRREGTIRGLHFQKPPFSEAKLLYCVSGAIWDVAVDLRADSPTFLRWHSEMLTEDNHCGILIPPGFAHGYQTLTEEVDLLYVHSESYHPEAEGGFNALDPGLSIPWPREISSMSLRDRNLGFIPESFGGLNP